MKIIYHRANSLAAIEKALKLGVDKIELDVRIDREGRAVLSHGWPKKDCLLLAEALAAIRATCPVIVDIKPGEPVEPIAQVIKNFRRVEVASFSFKILLTTKRLLPKVPLVVLDPWPGGRALRRARQLGTPFVALNHNWLRPGFTQSVRGAGFKLSTFTLNNPDKARRLARHGLYGVITDRPDKFLT